MSGIRVPVISQIVNLGIKKGCADMSPLVRKAAALAIPKCWRLDPSTSPQLLEYLTLLLGDKQYFVAGAAVIAFLQVCPDRLDLIHKHYRGLVRKLVDMDEWGQLATLRLMLQYSRRCFPQTTRRVTKNGSKSTKGFYGDEESEEEDDHEAIEESYLDPDLELLLKHALPLLQSRNSAVIIAVTRLYLYLAPSDSPYITSAIGPLISLLRSATDIQQVALYNIVQVALLHPLSFVPYTTHFLVRSTDPPQISSLKLELLTLVFPHAPPHGQSLILSELAHFSRASTPSMIQEAVRAIGRCAQSSPPGSATSLRCLRLLLAQLSSSNGSLVAESLTVIRHLIQANPDAHINTVTRLAKNLDTMTNPQARASIIWLVGEFAGINNGDNIAADVLRILIKGFVDEAEEAKLQIVLLGAKVYLLHLNREQERQQEHNQQDEHNDEEQSSHPIPKLYHHLLHLVRYDSSYTLRDRSRTYRALLSNPASTQLASLLLLAPKPIPSAPSPSESRKGFTLGSASLVIGSGGEDGMAGVGSEGFNGYESVPEWVQLGQEPDKRLREEEVGGGVYVPAAQRALMVSASERLDALGGVDDHDHGIGIAIGMGAKKAGKEKTLDDWLAEDEKGVADDNDSEEEDEETEESSDEEQDEGSDEDSNEEEDSDEEEEEESDEEEDERATLMK